ncbi:hypothetical protein MNBD_PLANCTO03-1948 [hydrothermal vent metagenome]|uniref:Uncharacterized protein n=1 Tax=hydrothermal vent metagenome TaxID=652676 RepID=A0A3B1E6A0_9ZZZZ
MGRKFKQGKKEKADPKPKSRRRLYKRIALGSVVMLVLSVAMVETTSQNWFCNSCHIMGPFYDSWKIDGAHSETHCVECHIDPGVDSFLVAKLNGAGQVVDDLLNRTTFKPSASVSAMACMRSGCHTVEDIIASEPKNEKFHFGHEAHVDKEYYGLKIKCTTCHSHVEGSKHFRVDTSVCITCHLIESVEDPIVEASRANNGTKRRILRMKVRENNPHVSADGVLVSQLPADHATEENGQPPSECLACHDPPEKEFLYRGLMVNHEDFLSYGAVCESCHRGVTSLPNVIDDSSCLACHIFGIERATETEEMHRTHAEGKHKIECFSCHGEPRHGPEAQTERLEEFDCRRCHMNQHNIQRRTYLSAGEDAGGDDWSDETTLVSPMFMAHVDCSGCHVVPGPLDDKPHSGAMVRRAAAEGCDGCHVPGLGEKMIPLWQNATRSLWLKADAEYRRIEPQVTGGKARQLIDEAAKLLELVEMDGSWGVHNPRYTQKLLEQAREKIARAREAITPQEGP